MSLFLESLKLRAQAVDADFTATAQNQPTLEAICQRLDCLPLALELAAAWVRVLPPSAVAAQLRQGLELLRARDASTDARQLLLRAEIGAVAALLLLEVSVWLR